MNIAVTSKHINKGKCGDPEKCAVAQAILEALMPITLFGALRVSVVEDHATIYFDSQPKVIPFSKTVTRFIKKFDKNKKTVKPFSFQIAA